MYKLFIQRFLFAAAALESVRFFIVVLLSAAILSSSFNLTFVCAQQPLLLAKVSSSTPDDLTNRLSAIERAVETRRKELGIPGVALAIVKDDKIVFSKGFGVRNLKLNLPVTSDTLFAIGSTTKAFTSMLAAMSADEGRLSFDDSPKKFLPYFKLRDEEADRQVTLRDLLSHRTGVDRADLSLVFSDSLTREELIKVAGFIKPTAKFREKWQYQNTMFVAAGEAVARANQTSWEKLVSTKIFEPLEMKNTTTSIEEMQKSKDFSLGYEYNAETKETKNLKMVDLEKIAPAGAINSNINDMTEWLRLLLGGGVFNGKRLVSGKNLGEIFTSQIQITPKVGYGFGWNVRDWRGRKEVDHTGNIDGFNAAVALIPEEHLGLVMLSNVSASPLDREIREIIYSNLLGQPQAETEAKVIAPATAVEVKAANITKTSKGEISPTLKEILGNYETEAKGTLMDIVADKGAVSLIVQGQESFRLIEKDENNFALQGLPEGFVLSVKRDSNGKITNLIFNQGASAATLRRVILPPGTPSVEELMNRVAEAAGGEANLRKHTSMITQATRDLDYEGLTSEITVNSKAPNMSSSLTKYFALGKQVGESLDYFNGTSGGDFTKSDKTIIGTPNKLSGSELEDARIGSDFYAPLNWKTLYKKIEIKKISQIEGEPVYIVLKTPENGHPIMDYISQKSFLVLRRETLHPSFGNSVVRYIENFSDYRVIDGVTIPFKTVSGVVGSNTTTMIVKSVKFNVGLPDATFSLPNAILQQLP